MRLKKPALRVAELARNPEPYLGKEITLTGVVHRLWKRYAEWDWYLADDVLQTEDESPEHRLILKWIELPLEPDDNEKSEIFKQIEQLLLEHVSIGKTKYTPVTHRYMSVSRYGKQVEKTLHYGRVSIHLNEMWHYNRLQNLAYVFKNDDDSWKTIEHPFIDSDIEAKLLELYRRITYEKPKLLFHQIAARTNRNNLFGCWLESEITGVLEQHKGDLILKDAWKAVIPTHESTAHIVLRDQQAYFDNFNGNPNIPVRDILQDPHEYYGEQITIRGLFTSDLVHFGDDSKYSRVVPNRLYYEYRSKWDNRVSLHLKLSGVTGLLSSHDPSVPGEVKKLSPNRNCLDVRITGRLIPPENEHSSIILDNITDLVSIHDGLIQHWQPYRLRGDWTWYFEENREL